MPSSRITSATSGWTRSPGVVPAESAVWRPAAARSNSAWLIWERPALCRQTNSAVAMVFSAYELVGERAERSAHKRAHEVDPEVVPLPRRQRGAERARAVEGRSGERSERDCGETHHGSDGDCRGRPYGAGVGGHADDHQHQEGGEYCLEQQRAPGGDARHGGAEVGGVARPDREQEQTGQSGTGELREPVGAQVARGQMAGEEEAEAHAGVEMGARDV